MFERYQHNNKETDNSSNELRESYLDTMDIDSLIDDMVSVVEGSRHDARRTIYSMANLVYKMRDDLHKYDLVLGDDASARLVTRFMKTCIDDVREERSLPHAKARFVAGGKTNEKQRTDTQKTIAHNDLSQSHVLFVSEYSFSGDGLEHVIETLQENNTAFDVAVLSIKFPPVYVSDGIITRGDSNNHIGDHKFFYGNADDSGLVFYHLPENGVRKGDAGTHRLDNVSHERLSHARKVMDICAHAVVQDVYHIRE